MKKLSEIPDFLRQQASDNNTLVLDEQVIPIAQLKSIKAAFLLSGSTSLTINGVEPKDIPGIDNNNTLTINAGTASLLKQEKVAVKLIFSEASGETQATIHVTMSDSWTFQDTFPGLLQFPFSKLSISKACFVYSPTQTSYAPWPLQPKEEIALQPGLNFASWVTLKGLDSIQKFLLIPVDLKLKFFGPIQPIPRSDFAQARLSIPLDLQKFSFACDAFKISFDDNTLSIDAVSEIRNSLQAVSFAFLAKTSLGLDFSLEIPSDGDALTFLAEPRTDGSFANVPFTADKITKILSESKINPFDNVSVYIPEKLNGVFQGLALDYFSLVVLGGKKVSYLELSVSTVKPWTIIQSAVTLEKLALRVAITDPAGDSLTSVSLTGTAQILPKLFKDGSFTFFVGIENSNSAWHIARINGRYTGTVSLNDIVNYFKKDVSGIPDALKNVTFSDFGISIDANTNKYVCFGTCGFSIAMLGAEVTTTLAITITYDGTNYGIALQGALLIGEQNFIFKLDFEKKKDASSVIIQAKWQAHDQSYLQFEDIASAFDLTIPSIPAGLDLALASATLYYDFTKKVAVINTVSANKNYGNSIFIASKPADAWMCVFGIRIPLKNIDLANLPIVGKDLASVVGNVGIENVQLLLSSAALTKKQAGDLNDLIDKLTAGSDAPKIPVASGGISSGAYVAIKLKLGEATTYDLQVGTGNSKTKEKLASESSSSLPVLQAGDQTPNVSWLNLQRAVGPVYLRKAGVAYTDGRLTLMLDAALVLSALQISFTELGVSNPLKEFNPAFTLSGLSLAFQSGPVSISGGFLRKESKEITEYMGSASIAVKTINISAFGSYATYEGKPSLFIYALLTSPPLGGPPAFYVTGVAAGFGYNRALNLPGIDNVSKFPLTSGFVPGQPKFDKIDANEMLKKLVDAGAVTPQVGQYWLAAGVEFTSFRLLKSYALLSMAFGTKTEIGLIGMSSLSIPPDNSSPLAKAQLALLVRISPDDGVVAVDGKLTQESYVLSQSCRLTGGFAFYMWTSPNAHAGDFVVTLGGYHPDFVPPDHYPSVPRLAFNWVMTSEINVKGTMYFALTPSCLMAGGMLQATFQRGDLQAWFIIGANFIIAWRPYYYKADLFINFGVSYTFSLDLLFTTVRVSISVSLGADVTIWGPEFSGVAHIHLWVISFTIPFGNTPDAPPPAISWDDFKSTFLPAQNSTPPQERHLLALASGNENTDTFCSSKVQRGLVEDVSGRKDLSKKLDWIVSRNQTTFLTSTLLPAKDYVIEICDRNKYKVPPGMITIVNQKELNERTQALGVGMVQVDNLASLHKVTLYYDGTLDDQIQYSVKAILGSVPKSLWKNEPANYSQKSTIDNVLVGFEITPVAPVPETSTPVQLQNLAYHLSNFKGTLHPARPEKEEGPDPLDPDFANPMNVMQETIASDPVKAIRKRIFTNLGDRAIAVNTKNISVEQLSESGNNFLFAPPVLAYRYWKKTGS